MFDFVRVSVIVPVFNGEKYLGKCLDSICGQTLEEIEIIIVDDGSEDSTPDILAEYAAKDPRIKIIRQENRGVGPARNTGLTAVSGKYIVFWDADDWFYPEALKKMYAQCEADEADLCVCDGNTYIEEAERELPSSVYLRTSLLPEKLPFNRNDVPDHILDFTSATLWNKMFRRSFLEENDLTFIDFNIGEDANYIIKALCLADRITVVDERLICYRTGQAQSLSMKWVDGKTPIEAFSDAAEYLKEHNILPERSFANKAWSGMLALLRKAASVWEVFSKTVDILKGGALEKMCVTLHEEGYYYSQWKEDCLYHLLNDSTEDFLCYYLRITFNRLQDTAGQYRSAVSKISEMRAESADLKDKINVIRDQRKELGEKLKDSELQKKEIEIQSAKLTKHLENAEEKIEELRGIRKELSDKLNASEKQVEKLNVKTEELRGVRKELSDKLNASEKQVEKLNIKTEELRTVRKELTDRLKTAEKQNEKLLEKTEILKAQRKEKSELLQEKREALAKVKNDNKVLKEINQTLKENNRDLREQNRKLKDSAAYKIGRVFTWLPRKIRSLFRKKK